MLRLRTEDPTMVQEAKKINIAFPSFVILADSSKIAYKLHLNIFYLLQVKYSCIVQDYRPYAVVPASQFGSSPRHGGPALHTQTKKVFVKNSRVKIASS